MKKSTRYAALAVALLPLTAGICEATIIFDDTFDSGTGAWYKANTTGATNPLSPALRSPQQGPQGHPAKSKSLQPTSRARPGKDIDETGLRAPVS